MMSSLCACGKSRLASARRTTAQLLLQALHLGIHGCQQFGYGLAIAAAAVAVNRLRSIYESPREAPPAEQGRNQSVDNSGGLALITAHHQPRRAEAGGEYNERNASLVLDYDGVRCNLFAFVI